MNLTCFSFFFQVNKVASPVLEVVSAHGKCVSQSPRVLEDDRCTTILNSRVDVEPTSRMLTPRVEVEPASRIPTPDEIEYSADESSPHHQLSHDGYVTLVIHTTSLIC